jgi:menaquinone reductase, multiheme cytochrome c subunit
MDEDSKQAKKASSGGWIFFVVGLIVALIVGWLVYPALLYSTKSQPLRFSHALHGPESSAGMECEDCHFFHEDGSFSGIPKLEKCMECHEDPESPLSDDPEEMKLLTEYVKPHKEIPWLVYSRQPDCVYFPHIAHVKMGNMECKVCHGDFGARDEMPDYKVNRISRYSIDIWGRNILGYKKNPWDRMKMNDHADCHKERGKERHNACFVCHK